MDDLFILACLLSKFITWSMYKGEEKKNMQGNHKENNKREVYPLMYAVRKLYNWSKGGCRDNMGH